MASPGSGSVCAGSSKRMLMCAGRLLVLWQSHSQRVRPAHTAIASRNTWSRKAAGRLLGVSTSTSMPSNCFSSNRIAPMSIIEVAVGRVVSMQRRAKHPHTADAVAQCDLADL